MSHKDVVETAIWNHRIHYRVQGPPLEAHVVWLVTMVRVACPKMGEYVTLEAAGICPNVNFVIRGSDVQKFYLGLVYLQA